MALTVKKVIGGSGGGNLTEEGIVKTYTVTYRVRSDDSEIGARTAIDEVFATQSLSYLAAYSTAYESDSSARLISVETADVSEDGRVWDITVNYTNKLPFDPDSEVTEDPLARPARLRFGTNLVTKTFRRDKDDQAVVTAAGLPMDQLPTYDDARPQFTISKNRPVSLDAVTHANTVGRVNAVNFLGFSPKTIRCTNADSEGPQFENGQAFYAWSFTFEFAPEETIRVHSGIGSNGSATSRSVSGWDVAVLDAGYRQLNSSNELVSCKDDNEQDATEAMPLSSVGGQLLAPTDPNLIGYRVFRVTDTADFNTLAIWP